MTYTCILCDLPHTGEPALRPRNGPVCGACAKEGKARAGRLRKQRKKPKRRKR